MNTKTPQNDFKEKVLKWLSDEGIDLEGKKIRVYCFDRYGLEVRIYNEPMEFLNSKKSRRKMPMDEDGNNSTYGIHSRKLATYIHINEDDLMDEDEKKYILEGLR